MLVTKSIWGWGTWRIITQSMNFFSPSVCISFLLETAKKKKKQGQPQNERQNKWKLLSYLTHFQVHMFMTQMKHAANACDICCSFHSGWDTLLARKACSYMEKHLSTAVMSASSILLTYLSFYPNPTSHPSSKTHMFEYSILHLLKWLQLTAQLHVVIGAMQGYPKQKNTWTMKLQSKWANPKAKRGQRRYTVTKLISRTLILDNLFDSKHLMGLWRSFNAGNGKTNLISARDGKQSFWIWSPHNGERLPVFWCKNGMSFQRHEPRSYAAF